MNDLEHSITKLMEIKDDTCSSTLLYELRDHLIDLFHRVGVGLLKRQQMYDE